MHGPLHPGKGQRPTLHRVQGFLTGELLTHSAGQASFREEAGGRGDGPLKPFAYFTKAEGRGVGGGGGSLLTLQTQ